MSSRPQRSRRGTLALAAGAAVGAASVAAGVHASGAAWSCPSRPAVDAGFVRGLRGHVGLNAVGQTRTGDPRDPAQQELAAVATIAAPLDKKKPKLDYPPPPPAASAAWPRWIPFLSGTLAFLQIFRRKLFGGSEAVALDPVLPPKVRLELIKSRQELRNKSSGAPKSFRRMLRESADTLEEIPALLVTVAVLAGAALQGRKGAEGGIVGTSKSLEQFRALGEAQVLLFTAGVLHFGMKEGSSMMRLLGGDFLFAEGQWMLAELGSLPVIRLTAQMIRDVSDGCSEGMPAHTEEGSVSKLGASTAMRAAFLRAGYYFSAVAGGAAWFTGAPPKAVEALRRYGSDLGCALQLAKYRDDVYSMDLAIWFARSAMTALEDFEMALPVSASLFGPPQGPSGILAVASVRGLKRLAFRVQRACSYELDGHLKRNPNVRGMSIIEFEQLRKELEMYMPALDKVMAPVEEEKPDQGTGMGFQRDEVSDKELAELIAVGLGKGKPDPRPVPNPKLPPFQWPEKGPKAALEGALACVGRELMVVNKQLDGNSLAEPANSEMCQKQTLRLFATGGKRLRPVLTLLVSLALKADEKQRRRVASLAASVEVLHSASLVHDDMLDGSDVRRGEATAHKLVGEKAATLVGDFLFATSSCLVAELGSMPVVVLISKVVADFGRGELAQSAVRFEAVDYSLEDYLAKSFYKTASLLAAACNAAAVLSGAEPSSKEARACYNFGAFVGLAFQVVDDVLDFTSTEEELGKPALADLKEGNLSAPVLFAAQEDGADALGPEARRELLELLERRLDKDGDLERVKMLIEDGKGVQRSNALSRRFVDLAVAELEVLEDSEAKAALRTFAEFVIVRTN